MFGLPALAELSMNATRLVENNPRPLNPAAIKSILLNTFRGSSAAY